MIRGMKTEIIEVRTGGRETVRDITPACAEFASTASGGGDGLLHVFVPHATAGIALIELGARSDDDLLAALGDLLPADERWRHSRGACPPGYLLAYPVGPALPMSPPHTS